MWLKKAEKVRRNHGNHRANKTQFVNDKSSHQITIPTICCSLAFFILRTDLRPISWGIFVLFWAILFKDLSTNPSIFGGKIKVEHQ